jgi:hypothetical protein
MAKASLMKASVRCCQQRLKRIAKASPHPSLRIGFGRNVALQSTVQPVDLEDFLYGLLPINAGWCAGKP